MPRTAYTLSAPRIVLDPTRSPVRTRRNTAPIATVNRATWITVATFSQIRPAPMADIPASRIVRAESQIAALTRAGRAWELTRAISEVALVAKHRTTACQPWFD